jgi:thioredoxin-related protein
MRKQLALLAAWSLLLTGSPLSGQAKPDADKPAPQAKTAETPKTEEKSKLDWLALDAAVGKAKSQNKHVIVNVYTTWCGYCRLMDKQTFGDQEVAAHLRENFVLAKVNGESSSKVHWQGQEMTEREFARAVGHHRLPGHVLLEAQRRDAGRRERLHPHSGVPHLREVREHEVVREGEDPAVRRFAPRRLAVTASAAPPAWLLRRSARGNMAG